MNSENPECSIVIPVYQGEATIGALVEELLANLGSISHEIILVNDGSRDRSEAILRSLANQHPGLVRALQLSRNFGEHNAVLAGLSQARGAYAVVMDDDFQNPPSEILGLIEKAKKENLDLVYGVYAKKEHSLFRNLGSGVNGWMANLLLEKPRHLYLSSFKCMSRFLYREILRYTGPYPYIDGLAFRVTQNVGWVTVEHRPRTKGKSGYTLARLIRLWMNMFFNFSILPLRISMVLGFSISFVGVLLAFVFAIEKLRNPEAPVGWASIAVSVLLFGGVQLIVLGVLGEYIGRLFLSANRTPQFVVREQNGE